MACGDQNDATSFYRAVGPFSSLRSLIDVEIIPIKEVHWAFLKGIDIVFMHRPHTLAHIKICEMVRNNKKPLWVDYDDCLYNIPEWNISSHLYPHSETLNNVMKILEFANVVTASTENLTLTLKRDNPKSTACIHYLPNAFDDYLFDLNPAKFSNKPIVLWRGSDTHTKDLMDFKESTMNVVKAFPQWKFVFMGFKPWFLMDDLQKINPDTFHIKGTDIVNYFHLMSRLRPSIGIVPLSNCPFNESKSNCAWLEFTSFGAVTLGPNWKEWNKPGITNYDDPQDFETKLKELISNADKNLSLHSTSKQYIENNLLLSNINKQRKDFLEMLVGNHSF
jgi:hypothetical protein